MKLYHFCASRHFKSIKNEGITIGKTPVLDSNYDLIGLLEPTIWLTSNKSFDQSWDTQTSIPYSRTDYRLTIKFPLIYRANVNKKIDIGELCTWNYFADNYSKNQLKYTKEVLNELGDPENWYIYAGSIPKEWIKSVNKKLE